MKNVPNPTRFITTAIELFNKKAVAINKPAANTPAFDPAQFYSGGHCAEFAYCLAQFAAEHGVQADITIMYSVRTCPDTDAVLKTTFSHCVVEVDGESFDISGDEARMDWFNKHRYIHGYDDTDASWSWQFVNIPFVEAQAAFDILQQHCTAQGVDFCEQQISKDQGIFSSLLARQPSDAPTP